MFADEFGFWDQCVLTDAHALTEMS